MNKIKLKTIINILKQIDEIKLNGITYDGKIIETDRLYINQKFDESIKYKIPDDYIYQSPEQTRKYKIGMCDSIAALIADDCKNNNIQTVGFVTVCNGIPIEKSSHFVVFCKTGSYWIRGDMSFDFSKTHGFYKGFKRSLIKVLDDYYIWAKFILNAKKGIKLYKYNPLSSKYYGMSFWETIKNIVVESNLFIEIV